MKAALIIIGLLCAGCLATYEVQRRDGTAVELIEFTPASEQTTITFRAPDGKVTRILRCDGKVRHCYEAL